MYSVDDVDLEMECNVSWNKTLSISSMRCRSSGLSAARSRINHSSVPRQIRSHVRRGLENTDVVC